MDSVTSTVQLQLFYGQYCETVRYNLNIPLFQKRMTYNVKYLASTNCIAFFCI